MQWMKRLCNGLPRSFTLFIVQSVKKFQAELQMYRQLISHKLFSCVFSCCFLKDELQIFDYHWENQKLADVMSKLFINLGCQVQKGHCVWFLSTILPYLYDSSWHLNIFFWLRKDSVEGKHMSWPIFPNLVASETLDQKSYSLHLSQECLSVRIT